MLGSVDSGSVELAEVERFANRPVRVAGTLHWDVLALWAGALAGLRAVAHGTDRLDGVGVDSWAVDYGLLDEGGALLGNPVHYRDERTDSVAPKVLAEIGAERLYQLNGLQYLPINTIFQLAAARGTTQLAAANTLLLVPDLLTYWLTGTTGAELTNASTTGLLDVAQRDWSPELLDAVGLRRDLLPDLDEPGTRRGELLPEVRDATGLAPGVPVWAVGSHDTASAVVGVPAAGDRFAYISCGTWSLVGLELTAPVLTEDSRRANFTNELGVDGTVRYLRNVMGLWLLQEAVRSWDADGSTTDAAGRGVPGVALHGTRRPGRPGLPAPGRHDGTDRRRVPAERAAGAAVKGRGRAVRAGQPGARLPTYRRRRSAPLGKGRRRHPPGGGRRPQRAALPAHRRRLRPARRGRPGGVGSAGQRAGAGPRAGRRAGRPAGSAPAAAGHPAGTPLRAGR
jgi:rhamnulokinase